MFEGNVGEGAVSNGLDFVTGSIAPDFVDASYAGAPPMDVFPATASAIVGAGSLAHGAPDDFNGTPRSGSMDAGAYAYDEGGNPGWALGPSFKASTPGVGPGSGGSAGSPGGGGSGGSGGSAGGPSLTPGGGSSGCSVGRLHGTNPLFLGLSLLALAAIRRRAIPSK